MSKDSRKESLYKSLELFNRGWKDSDERVNNLMLMVMDLKDENSRLHGLVRRLEKSNQQLGKENHRLGGTGTGWNKGV